MLKLYMGKDLINKNCEKNNFLLCFKLNYYNKLDFIKFKNKNINLFNEYNVFFFNIEKIDNYFFSLVDVLKKKNKLIFVHSDINEITRLLIEKVNFDFLYDPHINYKSKIFDFIHHFNSGLNHIYSKILSEKNKGVFISLNFLKKINKLDLSKNIGRINQNLKLSRKYKFNIFMDFLIYNDNDILSSNELKFVLKLFKISNEQVKNNFKILESKMNENIFKNSDKYITEGIEVM